ncbi:MAG: hypothetical protein EOP07_25125 [Proteobacteria bacterium]|nr:MAG: hypothetical protein EOP07_25125 [Pseudomonadota bacterium]
MQARRSVSSILAFVLAALTVGCAHYPDVRPGENGLNEVIFRTERKGEGFQAAFSQAKDYCDDAMGKKRAVRIKEESKYVGTMDESTYNQAKTASKVLTAVGGTAAVFGGRNESKAGAVGGMGGAIGDNALGADYEYKLEFKCN